MGKAIIFDGNSILNRAFYGVRPLTAPDGLPTNALFGFVGMINKAMSRIGEAPSHAAIAFDLKEKTFRHKACESYKATRKPMPDDLAKQLPFAKELSRALGLKVIEQAGFEADDILGTLSKKLYDLGIETFIVTGDRDSFQLINERVTVLLAANDDTKITTPAEIKEKYGVEPKQLIDVKAIMGDSSDNISGVPGIGEKGAIKLICEYGSLDNVYEHAEEISGAVGKKLRDGKESAYMSRFLAEIKLDAPLGCELTDCEYSGADNSALREFYKRLGFRQFLEKLEAEPAEEAKEAQAEEFLPLPESFVGKTLYVAAVGEELLINCEGTLYRGKDEAARLVSECKKIVCWSLKEAFHLASRAGVELNCECEDISLIAYVCSPEDNGVSFGRAALELLCVSSSEIKVSLLPEIYEKLLEKLTPELEKLYRTVELPLSRVLFEMEERGFSVDKQALDRFNELLSRSVAEEEEAIWSLAGEKFNINSPKQLGSILFEKLMLPHYRKTKSGYSTDVSVLEKLEAYHPIIPLILDYRKDSKLKNTY